MNIIHIAGLANNPDVAKKLAHHLSYQFQNFQIRPHFFSDSGSFESFQSAQQLKFKWGQAPLSVCQFFDFEKVQLDTVVVYRECGELLGGLEAFEKYAKWAYDVELKWDEEEIMAIAFENESEFNSKVEIESQ